MVDDIENDILRSHPAFCFIHDHDVTSYYKLPHYYKRIHRSCQNILHVLQSALNPINF